jgi:hypothetical protein
MSYKQQHWCFYGAIGSIGTSARVGSRDHDSAALYQGVVGIPFILLLLQQVSYFHDVAFVWKVRKTRFSQPIQ